MQIDGVEAAEQQPPAMGTHLGDLPSHLLSHITELAAPETWQSLQAVPKGRPDISPVLLACPPLSKAEVEAAEAAAAEDDDAPPPLL